MKKKECVGQPIAFQKFQGEILVAEIDNTICDGASMVESEGFIDVYDCPPIDTWFYLSHNASGGQLLYAWVPKPFVYYVHGAIKVNCVDCLYWYGG
ncbi:MULTISPECIES: hypothetical protein [unclassified Paraflavitalea]|uniref:hypothetical protein n=1 Tax=unclassified Paraflavitalea TaxID=2798305 RepID=UPI003D32E66E